MKIPTHIGFLVLLLFCNVYLVSAQRPEYPVMEISDSLKFVPEATPLLHSVRPFFDAADTDIFSAPLLTLPSFDARVFQDQEWIVNINSDFNTYSPFSTHSGASAVFPAFVSSAKLFHHASYRLNEKFTFGGSSFGINSIHSLSRALPGSSNWDTRGASMFMEYKVNRNFRIETRISVTGSQFP